MRAPKTADGRPQPYNEALCRATARMRRRMAEMAARIDLLEAQLEAERDGIAAERAALVRAVEGPDAQLAGLELAQAILREEAVEATQRRQTCESCGGLGRKFVGSVLVARIGAHCEAQGLSPRDGAARAMRAEDWPHIAAGRRYHGGRALLSDWLEPPRETLPSTQETAKPWRPPHFREPARRNPRDIGEYW